MQTAVSKFTLKLFFPFFSPIFFLDFQRKKNIQRTFLSNIPASGYLGPLKKGANYESPIHFRYEDMTVGIFSKNQLAHTYFANRTQKTLALKTSDKADIL